MSMKVIGICRVVTEPQLKYIGDSKKAVAEFRVASGEDKNVAFFDVKLWEKSAEIAGEHLTKGKPFFIDGRLTQESWETNGEKRSKLVVVVDRFEFLPSNAKTEKTDGNGVDF